MNKPQPGWRYFNCQNCNQQWWETTRDINTPSQNTCTNCQNTVQPTNRKTHPQPKTTKNGNIQNHQTTITKTGTPQ